MTWGSMIKTRGKLAAFVIVALIVVLSILMCGPILVRNDLLIVNPAAPAPYPTQTAQPSEATSQILHFDLEKEHPTLITTVSLIKNKSQESSLFAKQAIGSITDPKFET